MTEQEIREQYHEARSRVRLWCDEYHRHGVKCLRGDPRDIALIATYDQLHSLRERIRNMKVEV